MELYARRSPSLQSHAGRALSIEQKPLVEPKKIAVEGISWRAVRVDASCERRVADDLQLLGFHAYCPLGRKHVSWVGARQLKKKIVRQFPVFSRYIFAGHSIGAKRELDCDAHDKIHSIMKNCGRHMTVPTEAIAHINNLEFAGQWDETRSYIEKSPLKRAREVRIADNGPFHGFNATVDRLESESAVFLLVSIFGRPTPIKIDPELVELV